MRQRSPSLVVLQASSSRHTHEVLARMHGWSSGATGSVEPQGCLHVVRGLASLGAFMGASAGTPGQVEKRSTCGCLARQRLHVDVSTMVLEVFLTFLRCSHIRSGHSSTGPSYLTCCCQSKEGFGRISHKFYVKVATRIWSYGHYSTGPSFWQLVKPQCLFGRTFHVLLRWYVSGLTFMCAQSVDAPVALFVRTVCTWKLDTTSKSRAVWVLPASSVRTQLSLRDFLGLRQTQAGRGQRTGTGPSKFAQGKTKS